MRDLLTDPLCRPEDLGTPIPPTPYGVSVCLPTWKSVVGYEEKDPVVINKLQSGYPRFFIHPTVAKLIESVEKELAEKGERTLVFPKRIHAERCAQFIEKYGKGKTRVMEYGKEHLGVALFAKDDYDTARLYWRFCGEIVSTRQAEAALLGKPINRALAEKGKVAAQSIKERLAVLSGQGAENVFLFPSGMAAIFAAHRMLTALFPSRKTIQIGFPFVDTLKVQERFGAGVHFLPFVNPVRSSHGALNPLFAKTDRHSSSRQVAGHSASNVVNDYDYGKIKKIIRDEPLAGIFAEIPSNPLLTCADIRRIDEMAVAERKKIPIIIDDTIATSANIDAFRAADVVVTSLTKAFSGVGDVLAGSVILNKNSGFYSAFKAFLAEHNDNELWPEDAIALEEHSRDFAERVRVMSRNSVALYKFLSTHPAIENVYHSMNDTSGVYESFLKPGGGHCPLLSFVLKDKSKTPAFYDSLELCKGASLGTNFTLVSPYTLLAHYDELDWAESCGVDRNLIRVSCGLEPEEVIIDRMKRALDQL